MSNNNISSNRTRPQSARPYRPDSSSSSSKSSSSSQPLYAYGTASYAKPNPTHLQHRQAAQNTQPQQAWN